ncbi:MAG: hypothetical protein SVX38_14565 [Chloroflexota bacterium]|nr:hypothetical protein [Chloroflexota bacterium]
MVEGKAERRSDKLTLAEVWAYARCPYEHFWRYVARIALPPTARGLVEQALHQALLAYYGEKHENVVQCVGQAWRRNLKEWGYTDDTWDLLVKFVTVRARVLEPFLSGRVVKRDGSRYKVPQMSNEYKRRAVDARLPHLAARLDERLAGAPVYADEEYTIPDAFSDSVEIASRNTWPVPDSVVGMDVPFRVHLTDGLTLDGVAVLVTRVGPEQVGIEVHDYGPICPPVAVMRRDLRVVAALHASGEWSGVHRAIFRHLRSGATVSISRLPGTGRLLTAAIAAAAGIRHRVYVPRLAAQSRECLTCSYYGLCTDGQDMLDTLDPTLLAEIGM